MAPTEDTSQGRAVILPDGKTRRIDYIRDQYYNKGVSRSDIKKAINAMYKNEDEHIPYQIVFAATKLKKDAYEKDKAEKVAKAKARVEAKAKKEADAKAVKEKKAKEKAAADAKAKAQAEAQAKKDAKK